MNKLIMAANAQSASFSKTFTAHSLGAVDLSGLKFIQFKTELIAARALYHSYSIKKASNKE